MLNALVKFFTGREIILYNPHRNSNPLINTTNQNFYYFFPIVNLWKWTGIAGRQSRLRYRLMALVLTIIYPKYIIDINWIEKKHILYRLWCKKKQRQFIVLQHGAYHGGVLRDINEKYVNCTLFLVWSRYFKEMIDENNWGKEYSCYAFGNTCYNDYNRKDFSYSEETGNKILIIPSLIEGVRLEQLRELIDRLQKIGFDVMVKEHSYQRKFSETIDQRKQYRGNESLYDLLRNKRFDYCIADVSTSLLDAIFFKNRVIYFSPDDGDSLRNENVYVQYLKNLAEDFEQINDRNFIHHYIDIQAQEDLLSLLVKVEDTANNLKMVEALLQKPEPLGKAISDRQTKKLEI